jgi:hypothetical protein
LYNVATFSSADVLIKARDSQAESSLTTYFAWSAVFWILTANEKLSLAVGAYPLRFGLSQCLLPDAYRGRDTAPPTFSTYRDACDHPGLQLRLERDGEIVCLGHPRHILALTCICLYPSLYPDLLGYRSYDGGLPCPYLCLSYLVSPLAELPVLSPFLPGATPFALVPVLVSLF